ncbi:hypothetical protein [Streptomyces sp. NPDC090798]|uniref:hypothetical protein n=1 Tax=Streptomyces sp. NPDC090798 TaxID=3365968 RepID=UPI003824EC22
MFAPVHALSFGAPGAIVVAPGDTRGTVLIPERCDGYCMGLDGRDGPNLAGAHRGRGVATGIDDCSFWQAVWLDPQAVRRIPIEGRVHRKVDWETLAEERQGTPPVEPPGVWSPRWAERSGLRWPTCWRSRRARPWPSLTASLPTRSAARSTRCCRRGHR